MRVIPRALIWLVLTMGLATAVAAHFKLNLNVRVFHVIHTDDGLEIFMRMPMAYLVADKLGPEGSDGIPAPAPYTSNRMEDGVLMHLVDPAALNSEPLGLADIAAGDLVIRAADQRLALETIAVGVHALGMEPGFATADEARMALSSGSLNSNIDAETYVGDALVDVYLRFTGDAPDHYDIAILSDPGLPGQDETANLVLDHRDDTSRTYRVTGLMNDPIAISGSAGAAAATFITEGVRHILEGLDHVLFVLCLVIGASTLGALAARVTGFTVGHSVTLGAGFFGIAPAGDWFIPAVETAIALSIIYAAAAAVFQKHDSARAQRAAIAVTVAIGLLHGFGFSFMLREILQVDAENVWQSLLAFNVGVEIGQLAIVLLAWPVVLLLRRMPSPVWVGTRGTIAISVSLVAAVWVVERMSGLLT
ncbi:MAG: HupE/UreJ family protein [Ruegeria sp.]